MKYLKIMLTVFISLSIGIKYVKAGNFSTNLDTSGGESGPVEITYEDSEVYVVAQTNEKKYKCQFKYNIGYGNRIHIDIFDNKGNMVNEGNVIIPTNFNSIAGNYIGLDIYEQSNVSWKILNKWDKYVWEAYYVCQREARYHHSGYTDTNGRYHEPYISNGPLVTTGTVSDSSQCTGIVGEKYQTYSYNYYITYKWKYTDDHTDDCHKKAYSVVASLIGKTSPSYEVTYSDPNDIKSTEADGDDYGGKVISKANNNLSYSYCWTPSINSLIGSHNLCKYEYNINKTCINRKTGKVRYLLNSSSNCDISDNEIEIAKEGDIKTIYFIPLNTANSEDFGLSLISKGNTRIYSKRECTNIIKNYPNSWREKIVTLSGDLIPTDYTNYIKNGCRLGTSISFNTNQLLYNVDSKKIKGFHVYYQPIDITNPFPNKVADDSLWKKYNYKASDNTIETILADKNGNPKNVKETINLNESYSSVTYTTGFLDAKKVRNDNNYRYSEWSTMNANTGESRFVEKYITRNVDNIKSIYKIGAGPCVSISSSGKATIITGGICS